LLTPSNQYDN